MTTQTKYGGRGVSSDKEEVHAAITGLDKGIFPNAFCKIKPDLARDIRYCMVQHADTAGTKPALSYLMYKETGELWPFRNIVQDAIVMNTDDVACAGFIQNFLLGSTIGRNKFLIDGNALREMIEGQIDFIVRMKEHGINIEHAGGETADVQGIIRTLDVAATVTARAKRDDIVNIDIQSGMVVVGFSSAGQATYEDEVNSGIGSNGITNMRHDMLHSHYKNYPESFSPEIPEELVYMGDYRLEDTPEELGGMSVGKALLSPTRTYLPILKKIFETVKRSDIGGIIHNTGGGQTKVLKFLADGLEVCKDNMLPIPPIFSLVQKSGTSWKEMYKVFNMGHRLEMYVRPELAQTLIDIAGSFNVDAQVVGHVKCNELSKMKQLVITNEHGCFVYTG